MHERQPNSRHCFVCGLENTVGLKLKFQQTAHNEVTAEYTVPEEYQGYPGVVHGGIVAAILDEVGGRSFIGADPGASRFMYTARMTIHYRQIVPTGQPLRFVGTQLKSRSRTALASAVVFDADGNQLVDAEVLLVDIPKDVVDSLDEESLGWKVYPENT